MGQVLETKIIAGIPVTTFKPSAQMRLFAISALCDPAISGKDPETICVAVGIPKSAYKKFMEFEPWFSEWMEDLRLSLGGKNKRAALEFVGMQKAMEGDAQFWKPLALREGVIEPDKLDVGLNIPSNISALKELNVKDLKSLEDSIMAALRSESEPGEIVMAEGPGGWEPEGNSSGAGEVQEEPVVLAPELGADGERALFEHERL